jgi:hypothetical protein
MQSPRPVILHDEIKDIPVPAAAALAHRAVSRALDLLPHADTHPWPHRAHKIATQLLDRLARVANGAEHDASMYMLGQAVFAEAQSILESLPSGTSRRVAWLCVLDAMAAGGMAASSVCSWCHSITWRIEPRSEGRKAERIVANANWNDFRKIRLAFEADALTDRTPLDPGSLGSLWPKGPHDWSRFSWADVDAQNAERDRQYEEGRSALIQLLPRSDALPADLRDALDRTAHSRGGGWRHAFAGPDEEAFAKAPAAVRRPTCPITEQLLAFYRTHRWGALFIPPGELEGSLCIIPPNTMNAQRATMFAWDSALDCFDPEAIAEINRYAESIGTEPSARPAPCTKRDVIVFAQVQASPDAFFVVTAGPAAGKVFYFDHETGINFDQPVADTIAGWIDAIADPNNEHDWLWLAEID